MPDFPDVPDLDGDHDDDGATRPRGSVRPAGQRTPLLPPVPASSPARRASNTPNPNGRGLLSNARRASLETPDRPDDLDGISSQPELGDDGAASDEASDGAPERTARRSIERWEERFDDARTKVAAALGTTGERLRTAVPQSERVFVAGRTVWSRLSMLFAPLFAWLARLFHPLWSFVHRRLFKSRRRAGLSATLVVIAVLLATILPPVVTVVNALSDYTSLKTLGEDGLHHLMAAKDDLTGSSGSASGPGSPGSSDSSASFNSASQALDQLNAFFLPPSDATASAPYRYLAQRQSGTDDPITVTVHPAPGMTKAGLGEQSYTATLDTNTLFAYGVQTPVASPTPTPTATPTPTTTPTAGSPGNGSAPARKPDLQAAVTELRAANKDFAELRNKLNSPDWILNAAGTLPGTKTSLTTVRALADVGYDITSMGLELFNALDPVLKRAESGALSGQGDLITLADVDALQRAVDDADGYLTDVENRLPVIDLSQLPITPDQAAMFSAAMELLPKLHTTVRLLSPWMKPLGWVVGVGGARNFLVQTLDKAELRPSGGFTGEYGVLSIANGKLAPFSFKFADNLDYNYFYKCGCYGQRPPDQYSWWPVSNWGLRDSNLSPDFPTTAKINMGLLNKEGGIATDGAVQFTTTAVAHLLRVTGPLTIPVFNETVTADNLEAKLYYYQDTDAGIAKQRQLFPGDANQAEVNRKHFLESLTQVLQDSIKHLPTSAMLSLAKQVFDDLKSKDIQLYVTNTQIESQLLKLEAGGAIDTRSDLDGYLLVQANVSYNKDSPFVHVTQSDDVTLDDKGGAMHRLTITLYHDPNDPIYSQYKTYHDYVRVYVPPQARLFRGTGFDTGLPLCWTAPASSPGAGKPGIFANVPYCPDNPYPDGELSCPAGGYGPGPVAAVGDGQTNWASDVAGPPAQTTSDLAGRGMWGGFVVIPSSCTAKVTLRWYVPHIAHA